MRRLARLKKRESLQALVIVGVVMLALMKAMSQSDPYRTEFVEGPGSVRNESSTPRSFVLPATPGIAFEQERQELERDHQGEISRCLRTLIGLGYDVGDGRPSGNVRMVEAVYRFQVNHQLTPTGQLDAATKEVMGCL